MAIKPGDYVTLLSPNSGMARVDEVQEDTLILTHLAKEAKLTIPHAGVKLQYQLISNREC